MIYILNTQIKTPVHLTNSLQNIYGVGKTTSKLMVKVTGLLHNVKTRELRKIHQAELKRRFEKFPKPLSINLRQIYKIKCQYLINNNTYRGNRHKLGYPVRGQRTRTNASTQKKLHRRWILKIKKTKPKYTLSKKSTQNIKKKVFKKKNKISSKAASKTASKAKAVSKPNKYKV